MDIDKQNSIINLTPNSKTNSQQMQSLSQQVVRQRQSSATKFSEGSTQAQHYQQTNANNMSNELSNKASSPHLGYSHHGTSCSSAGFNAASIGRETRESRETREAKESRETSGGKIRSNSTMSRNVKDNQPNFMLGKSTICRAEAPKGCYMVGWGQLPFPTAPLTQQTTTDTNPHPVCLPSPMCPPQICRYSPGETHIVYLTTKNEAYGMGCSEYGQLGYIGQSEGKPVPIMEEFIVQDVFCTPYCTFFLTNRDEVYGCGLNNRGQLGVPDLDGKAVGVPVKIGALSKKMMLLTENSESKVRQNSAKKIKVSKIQSYALAQRKSVNPNIPEKVTTEKSQGLSQFYMNTQFSEELVCPDICQQYSLDPDILSESQFIISIVGGPYHSLALSNKGRAFYTGNIYKKSSILNSDYTSRFTELNLKKIGKVHKIKSGLTSIGLLNTQGSLFLLGAISEDLICDEPYNVPCTCVTDFGVQATKVWVVNATGQVTVFCAANGELVGKKVDFGRVRITAVQCGAEFSLFVGEKGQIFGEGTNYVNIFGYEPVPIAKADRSSRSSRSSAVEYYNQPLYRLNIGTKIQYLKSSWYYAVGLSSRPPQLKINLSLLKQQHLKQTQNQGQSSAQTQSLMKRIAELEKQNKILKELVKDENQVQDNKSQRNHQISTTSARKKDTLGLSGREGAKDSKDGQNLTKKLSNCDNNAVSCNACSNGNAKFDLSANVSEKIINKARKFDNSMEIAFEELELGKQISEGGYGIIYKATWRKTTVAVKIFKIDINSENSIKDFVSECHAMEALRHPNIVMFLGACTKAPNFAIVLEYCEGGTLWSILQKSGELSWQQRRKFALDTARGMNYLHERSTPILHRDLKSLNLLLDDNKRIKLADFGWTKGLQNYMTGKIGTYQWMAPEVVSSHQYTEKADVFSFGIILWEIASRQAPYRNIPGAQVAQDVLNKDLRPTIPKKTPEEFSNLMRKCWSKMAENRPSFSQIIDELEKMELPV